MTWQYPQWNHPGAVERAVNSEIRSCWRAMHGARRHGKGASALAAWDRGRAAELQSFLLFLLGLRRTGLGR